MSTYNYFKKKLNVINLLRYVTNSKKKLILLVDKKAGYIETLTYNLIVVRVYEAKLYKKNYRILFLLYFY